MPLNAAGAPAAAQGSDGAATRAAHDPDLRYTLTVEQVRERFHAARRRVPSVRTLQRYGDEGTIAALKIKTMFGNVPGREWLFNAEDVERYVAAQPIIETIAEPVAPPAVVPVEATPASHSAAPVPVAPSPAPPRPAAADASPNHRHTEPASSPSVVAEPPAAEPVGERRTLADVLIENARLVAQVEGRDVLIVELKTDKEFLREEVREARKTREDVKSITQRMLDVFKTLADSQLAGRLKIGPDAAGPYPPDHGHGLSR